MYFGLDTGTHTGLAMWHGAQQKFLRVATCGIVEAMDVILRFKAEDPDVTVVIEDARLRTWIPREKSLAEFKGKAMGAGSVKRDASVWEEFCAYYGIKLVKVPPKHNTTKLSADAFARITGWKGRTSEHARDAAMLVFGRH